MTKPSRTLFIGNYLSGKKGTTSLAFRLKKKMNGRNNIHLVSSYTNKFIRLADMLLHAVFYRAENMVVDVYSGPAFRFAEWSVACSRLFYKRKVLLFFRGGKLGEFLSQHKQRVDHLVQQGDELYSPSRYLQHEFNKKGIALHYLPNFIDLSAFPFQEPKPFSYTILWVRSFTSIYQPHLAIETLRLILPHVKQARLTMVGPDDGLLASCKELVQKHNLESNVDFVGPVAHAALASYYHSHDVYLNTTQYESFGNALMEAASCGIPIVSTCVGEIPFIWKHEESALLSDTMQAEALSAHILRLWQDVNLRNSIIRNARLTSEQFAWESIGEQWATLLHTTS